MNRIILIIIILFQSVFENGAVDTCFMEYNNFKYKEVIIF